VLRRQLSAPGYGAFALLLSGTALAQVACFQRLQTAVLRFRARAGGPDAAAELRAAIRRGFALAVVPVNGRAARCYQRLCDAIGAKTSASNRGGGGACRPGDAGPWPSGAVTRRTVEGSSVRR
jgi:hypothetical protein